MIGVCLVTYNQEKYIAKAIESVLGQKNCPCPIRIYIGNDASSDGTGAICSNYKKQYPERIKLFNHNNNIGLVQNTIYLLKRIQSDGCEYIAMLDGDDYWCDDEKLMKEYSFLNDRTEYGLIHSRAYILFPNGRLVNDNRNHIPTGNVFSQIPKISISNCTVLFRANLLSLIDFEDISSQGFLSLDYVMYTIFSSSCNFGFLNDHTAVWRRDHHSVSNPNSERKSIEYLENDRRMWKYLDARFPGRFNYSQQAWEEYRNTRIFNIAFQYFDYHLAKSKTKCINPKLLSKKEQRKFLAAKNRFLFYSWCILKRVKSVLTSKRNND